MHNNVDKADNQQDKYHRKDDAANNKVMELAVLKITLSIRFCLYAEPCRKEAGHKRERGYFFLLI